MLIAKTTKCLIAVGIRHITQFREGEQFRTPTNRPAEYDLTYSYPFAVVEEYFTAEKQWDESIDRLIAETSLAVPPHR